MAVIWIWDFAMFLITAIKQYSNVAIAVACAIAFAALTIPGAGNYLLFHTVAEFFTIAIACGIFMLVWNARHTISNNYLLLTGMAYLFISILDLAHTLTYQGLAIVPGASADTATQLWLAGRFIQAGTFLAAPFVLTRQLRATLTLAIYTTLSALLFAAIFVWDIFPICFIEGELPTRFKVWSEYGICAVLAAALLLLLAKRRHFDAKVLNMLVASLVLTIISELFFTRYISAYGPANAAGHIFRVAAVYALYKAIIEIGLKRPYDLLFREQTLAKEALEDARQQLEGRVRQRTAELAAAVRQLEHENLVRSQAESALRDSERKYRELVENVNSIIMRTTTEGIITFFNPYAQEFFGYSRDEIIGQNVIGTIIPETDDEGHDNRKAAQERRQHPDRYRLYEHVNMRKNGGQVWVAWRNEAVRDDSGQVLELLSIGIDITDRKRAEQALEQQRAFLETLLETIPNPVFYKNLDGTYIGCNTAFEQMVALPRREIIGKTVHQLASREAADMYAAKDAELLASLGTQVYEGKVLFGPGEWRQAIFSKAVFRDSSGEPAGIIGVVADITELKLLQEELQNRQARLQQLTHELSLVEERERRQLATDLHDRVSQTLALTKIKLGTLGNVMRNPQNADALEDIEQTLNKLIEETRTLCFELSPPILYELGLSAAVEWLSDGLRRQHGLEVRLDIADNLPEERIDESVRIFAFRSIRELLTNAAKHAQVKSAELSINTDQDRLIIQVTDQGAGFNAADLTLPPHAGGGFGLLSIRERIQHIGGTCEVRSAPGAGTLVRLTTPFSLDNRAR